MSNKLPRTLPRATVRRLIVLPLCAITIACSGCLTRKPVAHRPPAIALAHPVVPPDLHSGPLEEPPNIAFDIEPPPRLGTPRSTPSKPRVAQVVPTEPAVAQKPVDPVIVPDLTIEQLNAAKSETDHSLEIAELNLSQTQGKKLNSTQEDVVSKIRGFMETAREAMKNSDWQRAKNLAKKAEVLSHELVANP